MLSNSAFDISIKIGNLKLKCDFSNTVGVYCFIEYNIFMFCSQHFLHSRVDSHTPKNNGKYRPCLFSRRRPAHDLCIYFGETFVVKAICDHHSCIRWYIVYSGKLANGK